MGLADRLDSDVVNALAEMTSGGGQKDGAAAMQRMVALSSADSPPASLPSARTRNHVPGSAALIQKYFARMTKRRRSHFALANGDVWMRCDAVPGGSRVRCTHAHDLQLMLERQLRSRCTCADKKGCAVVGGTATRALAVTVRCSEGRSVAFEAVAAAWPRLVDGGAKVTMAAARRAPTATPKQGGTPRGKGTKRRQQPGARRLTPIEPVVTPVERPLPADRLLKLSRRVAPVKALDPLRQFGRGFWHDTRTTEE